MSRAKKPAEKFTPGPWRALGRGVYKGDEDAKIVADTFYADANAALIAAAPEMYDLLKRIKGMLQFCELEDKIDADTEHEIGALLAKARGEVAK